jgi:hypothetical protein
MVMVNGGDDPEAVSPRETAKKTKTSVHRPKSKREVSSFAAACHCLAFLSSSVYDDANIEMNCV